MIEPTSLLKPWPKSTDLVRITCFVRNHVSWNTFWETLISTIIEWPQNFFGKAVSTVLGSLNALDTRYHTRTGQRGIIKTTSHVEPELYKEDMMKILKVVFTIRNINLSNTNSLFHVLQHNQNCLKVKNRMKIHLLRSTLPSFLPASPVSSVIVDKTLPIWQMFIFHHSKKDSFTRALSNICISYGQDFSSLRTTLAAEC